MIETSGDKPKKRGTRGARVWKPVGGDPATGTGTGFKLVRETTLESQTDLGPDSKVAQDPNLLEVKPAEAELKDDGPTEWTHAGWSSSDC